MSAAVDPTPLVAYTLALTLTPGPSALLIAASGARFGVTRCVPHLAGAWLGYELQLLTAAAGQGLPALHDPLLRATMQVASTAWLPWLGWRLLGARAGARATLPAPLAWTSAAMLQLANPKPWLSAVASAGLFQPAAAPVTQQGAFLLYAGGAGVAGLAAWAVAGSVLQRWLGRPHVHVAMNRTMAAAMGFTALWGLRGVLSVA